MSLDRKKLLIAEVKAELWAGKIVRKHEEKFSKLMESTNAIARTTPPTPPEVQGGNTLNQPPQNPIANPA